MQSVGLIVQKLCWLLLSVLILSKDCCSASTSISPSPPNIHAVIVSSSRYWFNYRHAINALAIYKILKDNGVPDSQIVLMIADEYVTNNRNPIKNGMFANGVSNANWYNEETEIDFRGSDVTVQNFIDSTLGSASHSIRSDSNSSLLIYVTGHGGDQFFKFQDEEELTAQDISNLMDKLSSDGKFGKALFIADTCQAFTLFDKVETENVLALGTSLRGENAYAHHNDHVLGLSVIERWTNGFLNQYSKASISKSKSTLNDLMVAPFSSKAVLGAHVGIKENKIRFKDILVSDFFGPKSMEQRQQGTTKGGSLGPTFEEVSMTESYKHLLEMSNVKRSLVDAERESPKTPDTGKFEDDSIRKGLSAESADLFFISVVSALVGIIFTTKVLEKRDKAI